MKIVTGLILAAMIMFGGWLFLGGPSPADFRYQREVAMRNQAFDAAEAAEAAPRLGTRAEQQAIEACTPTLLRPVDKADCAYFTRKARQQHKSG